MKKLKIAIIIMAAAVVAAVGIFLGAKFINDKQNEDKQAEEDKLVMFDFKDSDVDSIDIVNDSGNYTMAYDIDKGWYLANSDEFVVNASVISAIAVQMSQLKAEKILGDTDASRYGFDSPVKLTAHAGDKSYTLLIGDASPTDEYFYAMKENDENIYLISYSTGAVLCADKDTLKNTYLYKYSSYDIVHFALWEGAETDENIVFSMNKDSSDKWSMDKPYKDDSVYNSQINQYLTDTSRDEIYSFVQENCQESDYRKYGFDKPTHVFEISTADDTTKVIFGKDTDDGTAFYGLYPKNGQVVTFAKDSVTALGYTTLNMMNTSIFSADTVDIAEVEVKMPMATATLEFGKSSGDNLFNGKKMSDYGDGAEKAFKAYFASFNSAYSESVQKEAAPEGEAYITITYTLKSNTVVVIEYIPNEDESEYYAVKNGEYTGFTVKGKIVENIIEAYRGLIKNTQTKITES